MKIKLGLLLILFVMFIFTGILNAKEDKAKPAAGLFNPALLPASASYSYSWSKMMVPIGKTVFSIQKTKDGNFIFKCSGLENTTVEVNGKTLLPIKAYRVFDPKNPKINISATFSGNKATVKANLPTGPQNAIVDLPANTYHNDSLLMSLMAWKMAPGKSISFKHYNPANSQVADCKVTVLGEEKVDVPAGKFDTYHIKIDIGNGMSLHEGWYQKNAPHIMVKYFNKTAGTTAQLDKK